VTVETTTVRRVVPSAYPMITWSGVFAGVAVAIALGALFTVLGGAIGATAFNPYALGASQAKALTIGAGLWLVCANLLAFLIGGFVGSRTATFTGHVSGMLQGLTVWAVALVISVFLANAALSAGFAGGADIAAKASATADASTPTSAGTVDTASAVKTGAETIAWWTFAAIAFGAIGGIAGGRLGSEHLVRRELMTGP
jgi:hypothetical protein